MVLLIFIGEGKAPGRRFSKNGDVRPGRAREENVVGLNYSNRSMFRIDYLLHRNIRTSAINYSDMKDREGIYMLKLFVKIKSIVINCLLFCVRLLLLALIVPSILVHELGHLIAAIIVGICVEAFELGEGDIVYEFSLRGMPFRLRDRPVSGGLLVNSVDKTYSSWQVIIMLVGGLLANLLTALFCLLIIDNPIGCIYGVLNSSFVIFSLWPSSESDGYRCYQILRGKIPEGMEKS